MHSTHFGSDIARLIDFRIKYLKPVKKLTVENVREGIDIKTVDTWRYGIVERNSNLSWQFWTHSMKSF